MIETKFKTKWWQEVQDVYSETPIAHSVRSVPVRVRGRAAFLRAVLPSIVWCPLAYHSLSLNFQRSCCLTTSAYTSVRVLL